MGVKMKTLKDKKKFWYLLTHGDLEDFDGNKEMVLPYPILILSKFDDEIIVTNLKTKEKLIGKCGECKNYPNELIVDLANLLSGYSDGDKIKVEVTRRNKIIYHETFIVNINDGMRNIEVKL